MDIWNLFITVIHGINVNIWQPLYSSSLGPIILGSIGPVFLMYTVYRFFWSRMVAGSLIRPVSRVESPKSDFIYYRDDTKYLTNSGRIYANSNIAGYLE